MDAAESVLGGSVGLYLTYRAVRGFGYLILGRPAYDMVERNARYQRRVWRHLVRQETSLGKTARAFDEHLFGFSLTVQMATPDVVRFSLDKARAVAKPLFFASIDLVPNFCRQVAPQKMDRLAEHFAKRREERALRRRMKRRARRALTTPHILKSPELARGG